MAEIEFVGDWDESHAIAIASKLHKSLDTEAVAASIPQLEDNPVGLLSKRQKRLIELLRGAGQAAFQSAAGDLNKALLSGTPENEHECGPECGCDDWSQLLGYGSLEKAIKRDEKGRMYFLNGNNRWERWSGGHQWEGTSSEDAEFRFVPESGEFGRGVYFDVADQSSGWMRLRLLIDVMSSEMVTDEQFFEMESDFTTDLGLMLTNKGVKAVAKTDGDRVTRLMVRRSGDIEVQGAIANSGKLPDGNDYRYRLVRLQPEADRLIVDVEVAPNVPTQPLSKALTERKQPFSRECGLSGTPVVAVHREILDRGLVRDAVERCKLDGLDLDGVSIRLTGHRPDFLPERVCAFCLPSDRTVMLVHHSPQAEISRLTQMLGRRLQAAVRVDAIAADEALDLLNRAAQLSPDWWIEMLIKRYVGAIRVADVGCVMSAPNPERSEWGSYIHMLAYRGLQHWGSRRAIAECQAEDFRVAHDPAGLPNLVTLLWDVAVPSIARLCQQKLMNTIGAGDVLSKSAEPIKYVLKWSKLEIGVTHDKGDKRHGRKLQAGYGHIRRSYGDAEDGMSLDVYIGPDLASDRIFKVRQIVPDTKALDEHKYIIGCWNESESRQLYLNAMPEEFFGGILAVPDSELDKYRTPLKS